MNYHIRRLLVILCVIHIIMDYSILLSLTHNIRVRTQAIQGTK